MLHQGNLNFVIKEIKTGKTVRTYIFMTDAYNALDKLDKSLFKVVKEMVRS
jgi:hypothetical protein